MRAAVCLRSLEVVFVVTQLDSAHSGLLSLRFLVQLLGREAQVAQHAHSSATFSCIFRALGVISQVVLPCSPPIASEIISRRY